MTRTALYRHYAADGTLLYVGISDCLSARDKQHASTAHWHDQVHRTSAEWCVSRRHARALESVAIQFEKPVHNVQRGINVHDTPANGQNCHPLRGEIEDAARSLGISPSTVGERAGQGGKFYERLCSGKRVWPETADAVRAKIALMLSPSDAPLSEAD